MKIITVNEITKIGNRLQMTKMDLDQAAAVLADEELQEAQTLLETTDELLGLDVNFENIEKVQKFMEENGAKITRLGEQTILKDIENTEGD